MYDDLFILCLKNGPLDINESIGNAWIFEFYVLNDIGLVDERGHVVVT